MPALASPGPHAALSTTQDHPVSPFPGLQPWFLSPTLRDPCVLASISPRLIPPDQPLWGLLTTVLPGVVGRLFLLEAFPDHHTLSESTKALTVYTHAGYPVHMGSTPLNGPNHVSVGGRSQWAPERSHVHLKRCFLLGAHFVGLPSRRPVAGLCVCIFILEQSQVIQCHLSRQMPRSCFICQRSCDCRPRFCVCVFLSPCLRASQVAISLARLGPHSSAELGTEQA